MRTPGQDKVSSVAAETHGNVAEGGRHGLATRAPAGMCHRCGICPFADRRPDSLFGGIMRWHRTWCPGYLAHIKVYGRKNLSR